MDMKERVIKLHETRHKIEQMGGEERIERQHQKGKLNVRERIKKLFDPDSFLEVGQQGTAMLGARFTPADGVITGYGKINGRFTAVIAYDFTVLGGSIGQTGEYKCSRIREIALRDRMPLVWLVDSGGARISPEDNPHPDMVGAFSGSGSLFREQVIMSGVIPQVAAMVGPGAAGTAYIPALADFIPMVKGTSSLALGGPPLVKAAVGEDISAQELGGSQIHTVISGVADLEVENDDACILAIKEYLSYFPQHNADKPDIKPYEEDINALLPDKILKIIPDNARRAFDMYKVIKMIVDDKKIFDIKPDFAKNIITCLARIGGYSIGIVANNSMHLGGALDVNASDKAARFVWLCDAFNVPLLFLSDVPGFFVGSDVEKAGIIRHGAKMLYAVSEATVPKFTVVIRKSYGAGYYVMCGRAYEPDLILAWPSAEISVMGADGMVNIAAGKMLDKIEDPDQKEDMRKQMVERIKPMIDINKVANWAHIDDIIDPRETKKKLIQGLQFTRNKKVERPTRKHGVLPV